MKKKQEPLSPPRPVVSGFPAHIQVSRTYAQTGVKCYRPEDQLNAAEKNSRLLCRVAETFATENGSSHLSNGI